MLLRATKLLDAFALKVVVGFPTDVDSLFMSLSVSSKATHYYSLSYLDDIVYIAAVEFYRLQPSFLQFLAISRNNITGVCKWRSIIDYSPIQLPINTKTYILNERITSICGLDSLRL